MGEERRVDRWCVAATPKRGRRRGLARQLTHSGQDARAVPGLLRGIWQDASSARGWRFSGDWWTPSVDAVVHAVVAAESLSEPCAELGASRADAGVGLPEAFDDLWALFSILGRTPPPFVIRRFAESYAKSSPEGELCTQSIDPLTGLARLDYLRTRLGEVYGEAAAIGVQAHTRHGLLSVRLGTVGSGWQHTTGRLAIGRVLHSTFCRGETVADLCPTVLAVLTRHGVSQVPDNLAEELAVSSGTAVNTRRIRLPTTLPGALMQLDVLADPGRSESPGL